MTFSKPIQTTLILLAIAVAGCSDSRDPILGTTGEFAVLPPTVTAVTPVNGATGVAVNTTVTATFSEPMAPLAAGNFTVTCSAPCTAPNGTATLNAAGTIATFTLAPGNSLESMTEYTGTISGVRSAETGFGLQQPFIWSFTTGAAPPADVSVSSTDPVDGGMICPSGTVNATFDVPSGQGMDPNTITSATFTVTGPDPLLTSVVADTVTLDATGTIATFVPADDLIVGGTYTAMVQGGPTGVADLAVPANTMLNDVVWTFTVLPADGACLQPVDLKTADSFGVFGGSAGMTNTGIQTVINGDIGTISTATSTVTGFHDEGGDVYTETLANIGTVNGLIYTCTTSTTGPTSAAVNPAACTIATEARLDAEAAYLELAGLPGGPDPGAGNLANLTLTPGVYTAALGSFMIEGGDLTLDAQGDANAVWVFQMATTLTVGGPGAASPQSVVLTNGALPENVFWQVGSAATINAAGGGTMVGTIISQAGVAFSTVGNVDVVTLNGRALSLGASVTLVDTIINVPSN